MPRNWNWKKAGEFFDTTGKICAGILGLCSVVAAIFASIRGCGDSPETQGPQEPPSINVASEEFEFLLELHQNFLNQYQSRKDVSANLQQYRTAPSPEIWDSVMLQVDEIAGRVRMFEEKEEDPVLKWFAFDEPETFKEFGALVDEQKDVVEKIRSLDDKTKQERVKEIPDLTQRIEHIIERLNTLGKDLREYVNEKRAG